MGIIGRALNFISLGGLDAAHRKVIKEEDVFGFNVQNFLGYIPLFNFFVGPGRVEKANNVLREYEHVDIDSLTDQDQEEINHCKAHRVRGVIETIPVVGLLIFIIPDVLYGIVKGVSSLMASKKESKVVLNR